MVPVFLARDYKPYGQAQLLEFPSSCFCHSGPSPVFSSYTCSLGFVTVLAAIALALKWAIRGIPSSTEVVSGAPSVEQEEVGGDQWSGKAVL